MTSAMSTGIKSAMADSKSQEHLLPFLPMVLNAALTAIVVHTSDTFKTKLQTFMLYNHIDIKKVLGAF